VVSTNIKLVSFCLLVKQKQIDNAMKLAEKYVDFSTLVSICEIKSDADLLASLLDKFSNTVSACGDR
jgi:hypothetical protein